MATTGTEWQDSMLRNAARGTVALPLDTRERSRRDQMRHVLTIVAAAMAALAVANAGVLAAAGILHGFRDPTITGPDTFALSLFIVAGVPLAAGLFLFLLLGWFLVWRFRDADGHPWIFRATETDFTIVTADGAVIQAPWPRWRYESYRYNTYKNAKLALTGLDLSVDGRPIAIDVLRVRSPRHLVRAILQRIAAHGGATG